MLQCNPIYSESMKTFAIFACGLLLPAHAASIHPAGKPVAFEFRLAPGKVHEECLSLDAGKARKYQWSADGAVDFNIHYHKDKDVFYPVKKDAVREDKGEFTATAREDYCWMWTAKGSAVQVKGAIE